jgi:hypothetical protein
MSGTGVSKDRHFDNDFCMFSTITIATVFLQKEEFSKLNMQKKLLRQQGKLNN